MDAPTLSLPHSLGNIIELLDIGDEYFWFPERLVVFEHWVGHIPFAFWLTKVLRPRRVVELGTHRGNSYCAFCQAIAAFRLDAQACAVDTWKGDLHMPGEEGLLDELRAHHDPRYEAFSTLMPMTFDEARGCFGEGDIDLLHIDGTHTYEAVRHDFETWRSALSARAVVLFHDTTVRRENYGVWRLWQELSAEYPSFEFHNSYGLGVLGVGPEQAPRLRTLYALAQNEVAGARVRALFAARGEAHVSRLFHIQAAAHRDTLAQQLGTEQAARSQLEAMARALEAALADQRRDLEQLIRERDAMARAHEAALANQRRDLERLVRERDAATAHAAGERTEAQSAYVALSAQTAAVEARCVQIETERAELLDAALRIQSSTTWRVTRPLRDFLSRHQRLAAIGRRSAKLSWWILSGHLPARLRQRRLWRKMAVRVEQSGLFDRHWYLAQYPEVAASRIDPLLHYLSSVTQKGRDPGPQFSTAAYLQAHPEVQALGINPLLHFLDSRIDPVGASGAVVEPQRPLAPAVQLALPVADGRWEWQAYERVRQAIKATEEQRKANLRLRPFPMLDIAPEAVERSARELVVPQFPEPVVSIIVPVFNHLKETLECLTSVTECSGDSVPYEIIVADDASTDATEAIFSSIENLRYIRNAENLGFLRNCNSAAKFARGEYLLFLNNDVQVTDGWLTPLVGAFRERPGIGAVGSKIVYPSGQLQESGALINQDGSTRMIGMGDDPFLMRYSLAREVDYCSGACLMLERVRFEALGGFDDSFAPAYYEDVDICLRLREQGLSVWYISDSVVVHHLTRTSDSLRGDYKIRCATINRQKIIEHWKPQIDALNRVRLIAFYLPQFHPFPENDRWWGKGFTEWTNVTKAVPNYVGHYQPRMPAELGYYDLRVPEVMEQQAELARRYGIEGFCYHYYWFGGRRLLELPIERMLQTGRPDFPFCLCWANENWTRRWDGQETDILMAQQHSDDDDLAVIRDLSRFLRHKNYIRINGRPLLLIYRVELFPNFARTAEIWRKFCREEEIGEIYLTLAETFQRSIVPQDPAKDGCDAAMQFPPHGYHASCSISDSPSGALQNPDFAGHACNFEEYVLAYATQPLPPYKRFAGVMPGWDNTPRRQNQGTIFEGSTPGAFQACLEAAIDQMREHHAAEERIVFINAWNEWAEGAYLEPDRRFGHTYLEAVRNAQNRWMISND